MVVLKFKAGITRWKKLIISFVAQLPLRYLCRESVQPRGQLAMFGWTWNYHCVDGQGLRIRYSEKCWYSGHLSLTIGKSSLRIFKGTEKLIDGIEGWVLSRYLAKTQVDNGSTGRPKSAYCLIVNWKSTGYKEEIAQLSSSKPMEADRSKYVALKRETAQQAQ